MLKILILISLLQSGSYKERKQAEHELMLSVIPYATCKHIYNACTDPEVRYRIKRVGKHKWRIETREKYTMCDSLREDLQDKDFKEDWER